ncbi:MAG: T9SS type A sorting domain-containing protein [Bacteroidota bacterium]
MKYLLFFILLLLIPDALFSQITTTPIVSVASYFDISPPLKAMCLSTVIKADRSWKDGVVGNYHKPSVPYEFNGFITDSVVQPASGSKHGDTILQNFEGLANLNWLVPPDPCGDAGPDHYFQMVNVSCAIYNKSGVRILGPFNSGSIWNGMPHNSSNGDGIVRYDENAGRWFISQFSLPNFPYGPFYQMIAVSETADPTGSWFRWEFAFDDLPDYPKFAIWPDGYYMSFNRIRSGGGAYDGAGAAAFDRTAMLNGDPAARIILFLLNTNDDAYCMLPADCDGEFPEMGTPGYFFFLKRNFLGSLEFQADWNNPSGSTLGNYFRIPISQTQSLIENIPQRGTVRTLTPINDRLMFSLQFRKFANHQSMVVNHTVDVGTSTGIRWYELRRTTENWYIHQQSTYAPDSNFRWMGSMAMDDAGNIALGYSVSGPDLYPSVRYAGRMADDPLGQLTIAEREIIAGSGAQTGEWGGRGRWGDYSAMSVDPVDASTFWYIQEYFDSTSVSSWKTRIASFSFAGVLTAHATAVPRVTCGNSSCRLNIEPSGGTGNYFYDWRSLPPGFSSNEKDPEVVPVNTTLYIATVSDGISVCCDTVSVATLPTPEVYSGNDTSYCIYVDRIPLHGRVSDIISFKWTTSGDGIFGDEWNLNTLYFPGVHDVSSASVDLKLLGIPQEPCSMVSSVIHITFEPCSGIGELLTGPVIDIFPNPTPGPFYIRMAGISSSPAWIQIFNPLGETVLCEFISPLDSTQVMKFDISPYTNGFFFVKVKTNDRIIYKKIILH